VLIKNDHVSDHRQTILHYFGAEVNLDANDIGAV